MTFLQKYFVTPVIGAAGLFAGYVVWKKELPPMPDFSKLPKLPALPDLSAWIPATSAEVRELSAKVEQLTSRVGAVEVRTGPEFAARMEAQFATLESRMVEQMERIGAMEGNYQQIEKRLDAILESLDRREQAVG